MNQVFLQKENLNTLNDFYQNDEKKVCIVKGKTGFYKTTLVQTSLHTLGDNFLVFNVKCFENTSLDDIFLSIFKDLKNFAQQKKLTFSKIETDSFALRMNQYLKLIKLPTIIIFDSLQNVFAKHSEKEKSEILAFIKYLVSLNKFKIILISTEFPEFQEFLNLEENQIIQIETNLLTESETKEYLSNNNIVFENDNFNKFYELTKGNPTHIRFAINIITTVKTTPESLLNAYKYKQMGFAEFLIQRLLTFIPDKAKESLKILSLFNGGLPESFLIQENFFTKEQISYLLEKGLLNYEYNLFYIKSFVKKFLKKSISNIDKSKIHTLWKNFYNTQIPLKPNERILPISRNTMRAQIEYHSSNINEEIILESDKKQNLNLLSYLNSNLTDWNLKNSIIEENTESKTAKRPKQPDSIKTRHIESSGLEKYELTQNELALLGAPIDLNKSSKNNPKLSRTIEQQEDDQSKKTESSLLDVLKLADDALSEHQFEYATSIYLKTLNMQHDKVYKEKQPEILSKLALCCKKMNKTTEAIDFYNSLSEIYTQNNDIQKVNEIKLEIAQIYKETYRLEHAKVIYENFVNNQNGLSKYILFKSYIELAELEDSSSNTDKAIEYYEKAFSIMDVDGIENGLQDTLTDAYFKYALILDDMHESNRALEYYEKCIKTSNTASLSLSSSYSNAAEILKENNNINKAIEYYQKGLKTDIELSNNEGIYYICLKLALINENINKSEVINWLLKSLSAAKKTKENSYITNAYIEIGDFYSQNNNVEKALKSYLKAHNYYKNTTDTQLMGTNPSPRIEYIKKFVTPEIFEKLYKEVKNNE